MAPTTQLKITTELGDTVSAIATAPPDAQSAYVFAHGAGAGMAHPFMDSVARGLAERRMACLRYQFPYMQAGKRRVDAAPVAHAAVRAAVASAAQRWPGLALFAGGKSFGGRMTSQAQALLPLPKVRGLVFLGFPLHPAGKPSVDRADHLGAIDIPMLFVRGSRDALSEPGPHATMARTVGRIATHVTLDGADHAFAVQRRSGRTPAEVLEDMLDALVLWTLAWHIQPSSATGHPPQGTALPLSS